MYSKVKSQGHPLHLCNPRSTLEQREDSRREGSAVSHQTVVE